MRSPGHRARRAAPRPTDASQAAWTGDGASSGGSRQGTGQRRPGAHRAGPPDGLIPGFPRAGQVGEGGPIPDPYPADLPTSGDAGLAGEGYGHSLEGGLIEAEFERYYRPARPPGSAEPPTQPLVRAPAGPAGGEARASPSLMRSSGVMALGTLASRITGLIRTLLIVPALGVTAFGNAYNYANGLPNTVYNLAIGGILTSVIVPLLVNAARRSTDRGEQYDQRMFTLIAGALLTVTLAATLAAAPIARLYDPHVPPNAEHLLVIFAYFFAPQIFFYGMTSLAGAILNARGHFAAPMWTPVVNNVVVIFVTITFMVVAAGQNVNNPGSVTGGEVLLLGIGTTLGIVAQTAALIPALRRVGFRWRPRFDFRREEVAEIGRMSGWMFCYVLTTQVAFLVTARVASSAGTTYHGVAIGYSAYTNAWMLFQLPYAVVAISVITALLPRMSAHASERRYDLVRSDFSTGVRLGSVVVAPAALILAVLGPSLAEVLLAWHSTSEGSARYLGLVFSLFSLGLMPYMLFQLLLRVFYSLHDSKTPALIGVATMIANILANVVALLAFPPHEVIAVLGVGFGVANTVGTIAAWRLLSRRIGGLGGRLISASLVRMHAAAAAAALFALAVTVMIEGVFSTAKVYAALTVVIGGGGGLVFYYMFAKALRVREVTDLSKTALSRFRR